eukprot:UN02921
MDPQQVAQSFVQHYYHIMDGGKDKYPQLAGLYRDSSMLTWETNNVQGAQAIVQKLLEMPFNTVQHRVTSVSAQPSGVPNALLVAVNGELIIDSDAPIKFNQVWHLLQEGNAFWIHNDIFRLNY